jgi:acetate kinase
MAAAAGGIDALVFTGGIGERSAPVRRAVTERLEFLGLVHSGEDLELARQARELLQGVPHRS